MFLQISDLDKRRAAFKQAATVLRFIQTKGLDAAILEFGKREIAPPPPPPSSVLRKTDFNEMDTLKMLLTSMQKFEILTEDDATKLMSAQDSSVRRLCQIMDDLHNIYADNTALHDNAELQQFLKTNKLLTASNQIKTVIETSDTIIATAKSNPEMRLEANRIRINLLTVQQFCYIASFYARAIIAMMRVILGYTKPTAVSASLSDAYTAFKVGGRSGVLFSQFVQSALVYVGQLQSLKQSNTDINLIQSELEIVETLDKYFDPVSKTFNVQNVYTHLLSPLNAIYEEHKKSIDNPEALASLHRLTNFGTFQRFPTNVAMQTKYLHSMSIAANMLKGYVSDKRKIDALDVERSYAEWPFEFEPGSTLNI